jgi:branched-chain amino acid transport system ATP-binding protein
MLEITDLHVDYAGVRAVSGASCHLDAGALAAVVGANGAGKSSLLAAVSGLHPATSGRIVFDGEDITRRRPDQIAARGLVLVPEGRRLFTRQTVLANLMLGAYLHRDQAGRARTLAEVHDLFPVLGQRRDQVAGTLSGGEQQMLAVGRALMSRPRLLMLDEPSIGLSPTMAATLFQAIAAIHESGTTVLLVEQNQRAALTLATSVYVLHNGTVIASGSPTQLRDSDAIQRSYLGL